MATNFTSLSNEESALLADAIDRHTDLGQVLAWAASKPKEQVHPQVVAEVINQDEFTHDIIVPFRNMFLVYDTT